MANLHATGLDALAAAGRSLVGRQRGVAGDDVDHVEPDLEFFRRHLTQGGRQALTEIDFAAEDSDPSIGADLDEAVDGTQRQQPGRQEARWSGAPTSWCDTGEGDANNERAGTVQDLAAGQGGRAHGNLPERPFISPR